jgi:hypothetical protein
MKQQRGLSYLKYLRIGLYGMQLVDLLVLLVPHGLMALPLNPNLFSMLKTLKTLLLCVISYPTLLTMVLPSVAILTTILISTSILSRATMTSSNSQTKSDL